LLVCADLALLLTRPVVIIDGRSLAQWGRWWGVDWTAPWLIHYRIVYIYIHRCVFVWESVLPVGCLQYICRTFVITESTKQPMCGDFSSDRIGRALRKTPPGSGPVVEFVGTDLRVTVLRKIHDDQLRNFMGYHP
jgi:hypothetical protein